MVATAASAAPEETPIRPGIGKRIAEHALHHRAGDGERGAHECAEQQARQADVDQHELLAGGRGVGVAAERGSPITRGRAESVMPVEPIESDRKAASASSQRRNRHQLAGATLRAAWCPGPPIVTAAVIALRPRRRRQGRDRACP